MAKAIFGEPYNNKRLTISRMLTGHFMPMSLSGMQPASPDLTKLLRVIIQIILFLLLPQITIRIFFPDCCEIIVQHF